MMLSLRQLSLPVIARVHGMATAAGCQLVAQCDLAVASSAARFAVSGINLGLFCSTPACRCRATCRETCVRDVGDRGFHRRARSAAARTRQPRGRSLQHLDAAVEDLVGSILEKPRAALALGKELFYRQGELPIEAAYEIAGRTMACNTLQEAAVERVEAFIGKRPARL